MFEQQLAQRQQLATNARELQTKLISIIGNEAYLAYSTYRTHLIWLQVISDKVASLATDSNISTETILECIEHYPTVNDAYCLADQYIDPTQFNELCKSVMDDVEVRSLNLLGDNSEEAIKLLDQLKAIQTELAAIKIQVNSNYGKLAR